MDKNFKPLKNNPNIFMDTSKKQADLELTNELARRNEFESESVASMEVNAGVFSSICVICDSDIHAGSIGSNAIREEMKVNFIKNTANAYSILNGDMFNSIIKAEENIHDDKFGTNRQIERAIHLYEDIKDKIVCVIDGNHDGACGKRWTTSTLSPCKHFADALGLPSIEFGVNVKFNLPTSDFKRENQYINIYFSHATGKSSGDAKSVDITFENAMTFLSEKGITPDVVFGGHFHSNSNGSFPVNIMEYDEYGKCIGVKRKDIITVSESTLQEVARYAQSCGYPKADSNVYLNNIRLVKNPYYTNASKDKQPEYVVELTRFPMFKNGKNEYTEQALMYMRKYQEPTWLEDLVEKEYAKLSTTKAISKLANENKNFISKQFLSDDNEDIVVNE